MGFKVKEMENEIVEDGKFEIVEILNDDLKYLDNDWFWFTMIDDDVDYVIISNGVTRLSTIDEVLSSRKIKVKAKDTIIAVRHPNKTIEINHIIGKEVQK